MTGRADASGQSITFFTHHDRAHAGHLRAVLTEAGQPMPEAMNQFSMATKKKTSYMYGDFIRSDIKETAKKITFD